MIGDKYKAHRDNVLDLYEGYLSNREIFNSSIGFKDGDGIDLDFLKKRIKNLKEGKFTLAVAGEVKAGKSTFLNALLGCELLPSDVLQATSAIVEIFKSEKSYLKVRYADGREEEIYDKLDTPDVNEARKRLLEICKISDEFREIPTTLIDQYIVNSDVKVEVSDELIKEWEAKSQLRLFDKKEDIINYIESRPKSSIPVQVLFGYPMKWEFDELRIVDTPGVNAIGGVQNISFSYLESANAILFIHPIKPIESESFVKFINQTISNRSREFLFLVLTHAGLYPEKDIEKLYNDAIRIYGQFIPKERILVVDSVLQLIINDFNQGKTQEEIEKESEQKSNLLGMFEKRAKNKGKPLLEILKESSGFDKSYEVIDSFSLQGPYLQLGEILQSLRDGYAKQEEEYKSQIELLEYKKQDPQTFEGEIYRIQHALDEYKLLLNKTKEEIKRNYSGIHDESQITIDKLKETYPQKITTGKNFESVRKAFTDGFNAINDFISQITKKIKDDLKNRLKEIKEEFKEEHKITLPAVDLDSLMEQSKKEAFKKEDIYKEREWDLFDIAFFGIPRLFRENIIKVGEKKIYDEGKHLDSFKTRCNQEFYSLVNNLQSRIKDFVDTYLKLFSDTVKRLIEARKEALNDKKKKKASNEEIISQINELSKKKAALPEEIKRIDAILEDIK